MYKLNFFVPIDYKEKVKLSLFEIGVGKYKNYDCCSFESLGTGQFRAIHDAKPFLGKMDEIEVVQEYKVEMICSDALIQKAVAVLKQNHPYEEVAYEVFKLEAF